MPAHNAPHDDPDMQRRGLAIPQTARDAKSVEDGDRPEEIAIVEEGAEVRPPASHMPMQPRRKTYHLPHLHPAAHFSEKGDFRRAKFQ